MIKSDTEEPLDKRDESNSLSSFLLVAPDDIEELDFEKPISELNSADCCKPSIAYREAAKQIGSLNNSADISTIRVFEMLAAVTNFHFKPKNRNAPFGPMVVLEGRRSAIPEDFRGAPVLVLADAAERATNPVLSARLSDVCWLLERNRRALGKSAVASYAAIVEGLTEGRLQERFKKDNPGLGLTARDSLQRALTIGRSVGWECDEVIAAKRLLLHVRERALAVGKPVQVHWFYEMDLDFGITAPRDLRADLEAFLEKSKTELESHIVVDLFRLAARAYHLARDGDSKHRCSCGAAESLVAQSEKQSSAMLASHWLSAAIAEYHGIPNKRERRTELRHKLIDAQSGIFEEMSPFSHPLDLSKIVQQVETQLEGDRKLLDLLFIFADLGRSPSLETLIADAQKAISNHPFSALFGASFHDKDGKVTYRSEGGSFGENGSSNAVQVQIAQAEKLRRQIFVQGSVLVARRYIMDRYYLGEDTFHALFVHSPFVPNDLIGTFSRGFVRFFEGDYISALYTLTPLLENSLRHIMKTNGLDVTTFDNATQTQQDRSISALFDQMRPDLEEIFGKDIIVDIDNVFLSSPGPCIRHDVAHGLLSDGSPYGSDAIYGCWLIFRLCCIPLFDRYEELNEVFEELS